MLVRLYFFLCVLFAIFLEYFPFEETSLFTRIEPEVALTTLGLIIPFVGTRNGVGFSEDFWAIITPIKGENPDIVRKKLNHLKQRADTDAEDAHRSYKYMAIMGVIAMFLQFS